MWLSFPYAYSMRFAFDFFHTNISHHPFLLTHAADDEDIQGLLSKAKGCMIHLAMILYALEQAIEDLKIYQVLLPAVQFADPNSYCKATFLVKLD